MIRSDRAPHDNQPLSIGVGSEGFKSIRAHVSNAMAEIAHPDRSDESIEVEIIDRESHHGEYVQVEAVDDDVSVVDPYNGEQPWLDADEVEE